MPERGKLLRLAAMQATHSNSKHKFDVVKVLNKRTGFLLFQVGSKSGTKKGRET